MRGLSGLRGTSHLLMECPFCNHAHTGVSDSRPTEKGQAVRRRRKCKACKKTFTTYERVQLRVLKVSKRDGTSQTFERDKLARSIEIALRRRDVEQEVIERSISEIQRTLEKRGDNLFSTELIGEMALEQLLQIDPVGYIRFASVYRNFQDVAEFNRIVERFRKRKGNN